MAYMPRPDGLNDVVLDDGTRVPTSLSADQLQAMGHEPIPMPQIEPAGLPPNAVAGPGGAPEADISALYGAPSPASVPALPPSGTLPGRFGTAADQVKQMSPAEFRAAVNSQPSPDAFRAMVGAAKPPPGAHAGAPPNTLGLQTHIPIAPGPRDFLEPYPDSIPEKPAAQGRNLVPLAPQSGRGSPYTYAPQASRSVRVKGGDVRASFVRQPGEAVGDDVKSDLLNNDPEQADINAVENYDEREKQRLDVAQELQGQQQQIDHAAARRAQIDNMLQQKQQLIDERDREAEKLTPQTAREVWEDKSTLARVFAGLSIALGGALQGLQGRANNPGLDMINQSIRDEVGDQRARYEAALKKGQTIRNDYSQALALYGTPEAAALDLEMRRNALAAKLIQNQGQSIENRDKQQAAFQVADQMRAQRAELKIKLSELEKGKVLQENWVNVPDRYGTVGGPPKLNKDARERLVRLPDGNYGFVRAAEARDKVQGKLTAGSDILTGLQKLQRLAGSANLKTDLKARSEYNAIAADISPLIAVATGQGAMSEGDRKNVESLLGSPNAVIQDNGAALDQATRGLRSRIDSTVRDNVHADPDALYPYAASRPQVQSDE